MKCPNCCCEMINIGFIGSGHVIYHCEECRKRFEIKEVKD